MPPPADHPCLHLSVIDEPFFVMKLPIGSSIPEDLIRYLMKTDPQVDHSRYLSITRTSEEISIAGASSVYPSAKATWNCIKIAGPMAFGDDPDMSLCSLLCSRFADLTGVLSSFTAPLAKAGSPVFAMSTWFA